MLFCSHSHYHPHLYSNPIPIPVGIPRESHFHGNPIPMGPPIPMHTSTWKFHDDRATAVFSVIFLLTNKATDTRDPKQYLTQAR